MSSINMGPCYLYYGGTFLGEGKGGTRVSLSYTTAKSTADSTGETARQKVITGQEVMLKTALTELGKTALAALIPVSEVSGNAVLVKNAVGTNLVSTAKVLIAKPIIGGVATTDESEWFTLPAASCLPNFEVPFEIDNQRVWAVEFEGHLDSNGVIAKFFGGNEAEGS